MVFNYPGISLVCSLKVCLCLVCVVDLSLNLATELPQVAERSTVARVQCHGFKSNSGQLFSLVKKVVLTVVVLFAFALTSLLTQANSNFSYRTNPTTDYRINANHLSPINHFQTN